MEAFDLGATIGAEIHKDSDREPCSTEITESLVVLLLRELRQSLAFYDDIPYRRFNDPASEGACPLFRRSS